VKKCYGAEKTKFCPICGMIMNLRYENTVPILTCPRCGYKTLLTNTEVTSFKKSIVLQKTIEKRELIAFDIPTTAIYANNLSCPKCGSKSIYYWRRHVSTAESSDIIEKMFRCINCGYSWSEFE